jgi:hypothetical protein
MNVTSPPEGCKFTAYLSRLEFKMERLPGCGLRSTVNWVLFFRLTGEEESVMSATSILLVDIRVENDVKRRRKTMIKVMSNSRILFICIFRAQ